MTNTYEPIMNEIKEFDKLHNDPTVRIQVRDLAIQIQSNLIQELYESLLKYKEIFESIDNIKNPLHNYLKKKGTINKNKKA